MTNLDHYAQQIMSALALHRFHIHVEEVKRALQPILQDVNERNVAGIENTPVPEAQPATVGTIEAVVELIHHEPDAEPEDINFERQDDEDVDVQTEEPLGGSVSL